MKKCILIILCFSILAIISGCRSKNSKDDNDNTNSNITQPIESSNGNYNSIPNELSAVDILKEISAKVATDEMNNYIHHESGIVSEANTIHFTDSYFHYSFDAESMNLSKVLCTTKGSGEYYGGMIIDGLQFNLRGQICKSGNLPDAFFVEPVEEGTVYSILSGHACRSSRMENTYTFYVTQQMSKVIKLFCVHRSVPLKKFQIQLHTVMKSLRRLR